MTTHSPLQSAPPPWLPVVAGLCAFALSAAVFWSFDAPWTLRGDNKAIMFPMNLDAFRAWSDGRVPHWSGGFWCGFPLIADPTSLSMYWPNLLAFLATGEPYLRAYDLSTAFHAGVLVAGTVWLLSLLGARHWVAAFGGVLILLAPMHVWYASAMITGYAPVSWWPLMLVSAEMLSRPGRSGRYLVLGWLSLASCATVYPEFALYGGAVAVLWLLTRTTGVSSGRRLLLAVVLGAGGLALAAPQLLPAALLLPDTTRGNEKTTADFSVILFDAARVLYPTAREMIPTFLGVSTLLLAVFAIVGRAPRRLFLSLLAVSAFLCSLGGLVYAAVHSLPVFDLFRQPMKFKLLTELAVVLLASLGLEMLLTKTPSGFWRRCVIVFSVMVMAEHYTWVAVRVPRGNMLPGWSDASFSELYATLMGSGMVADSIEGAGSPPPRQMDRVGLRSLPMIEGVPVAGGGRNSLLPSRHRNLISALAAWPGPSSAELSYFGVRSILEPDFPSTQHDANPCLQRARSRGLLLIGRHPGTCLFLSGLRPTLVDIPRRVRRAEDVDSMVATLEMELRTETSVLTYAPQQRESRRTRFAANRTEAEVRLLHHELREDVPIVVPDGVLVDADPVFGRATIMDYRPGAIRISTSVKKPAYVLVKESYFDGWEAFVDGARASIYPAAGLFFAVPVPSGSSDVFVSYVAPGFRTGLQIALGWVVLSCVAGIWLTESSPKDEDPREPASAADSSVNSAGDRPRA